MKENQQRVYSDDGEKKNQMDYVMCLNKINLYSYMEREIFIAEMCSLSFSELGYSGETFKENLDIDDGGGDVSVR